MQFNYNLARAFVLLAEPESAMERLTHLLGASPVVRSRIAAWINSDLDLAPLRQRPDFENLLAELGRSE